LHDNKYINQTAVMPGAVRLFLSFFKIGATTFGSGLTMIPAVKKEAVRQGWMDEREVADVFAVSESLPGSVAVNCAVMTGYRVAGISGAFFAALGVVLPSFCVIYVLSFFLGKIEQFTIIGYMFRGIRVGVLALILKAMIDMIKASPRNVLFYITAAAAFIAVAFFGANVFAVILCAAALSLVCALAARKKAKRE
jgi:chromate transporter